MNSYSHANHIVCLGQRFFFFSFFFLLAYFICSYSKTSFMFLLDSYKQAQGLIFSCLFGSKLSGLMWTVDIHLVDHMGMLLVCCCPLSFGLFYPSVVFSYICSRSDQWLVLILGLPIYMMGPVCM